MVPCTKVSLLLLLWVYTLDHQARVHQDPVNQLATVHQVHQLQLLLHHLHHRYLLCRQLSRQVLLDPVDLPDTLDNRDKEGNLDNQVRQALKERLVYPVNLKFRDMMEYSVFLIFL